MQVCTGRNKDMEMARGRKRWMEPVMDPWREEQQEEEEMEDLMESTIMEEEEVEELRTLPETQGAILLEGKEAPKTAKILTWISSTTLNIPTPPHRTGWQRTPI